MELESRTKKRKKGQKEKKKRENCENWLVKESKYVKKIAETQNGKGPIEREKQKAIPLCEWKSWYTR
jgi:hypothetical protein